MYANLTNSYQWNLMNKDNAIVNRISEVMKVGSVVKVEEVNFAINTIKNRLRTPLFNPIMDALKSGRLVMVYCDTVKIPLYLPYMVLKTNGTYTGVVFINHCEATKGGEDAKGEYNVNARKLKVSLESCYMAVRMMELDAAHNTKLTAPSLIRPATKIYIHTMAECMNRKFSIKLDQTVYNQVLFLLSEFFIGTVLGYHPDNNTMENFCLYNCKNADLPSIRTVTDQFEPEDFKDISTFITKLTQVPELRGRLGKLNVSTFIQMYVNMYNAPMTLAMETFSYFVFNVISVNQSTYVNNYHMLKNIVGDDGSKLYAYLVSILGGE
jgi:hypothetical protein